MLLSFRRRLRALEAQKAATNALPAILCDYGSEVGVVTADPLGAEPGTGRRYERQAGEDTAAFHGRVARDHRGCGALTLNIAVDDAAWLAASMGMERLWD
jgi:hypothetical protein